MKFAPPKIYPITDRELSGLSHAEQVRQLVDGGATLIQIRDKTGSTRELFADASTAVRIAHEHGVTILINDRLDIALTTAADGVHLGQDDLPVEAARRLLGKSAVIGVSAHTVDQVTAAASTEMADYIAFGPIFQTLTKADHEPIVGLGALRSAREAAVNMPLVAIGGIKRSDVLTVLEAGADSAALISELFQSEVTISDQYRRLNETANNNTVVHF